jgi:hypothetical protein
VSAGEALAIAARSEPGPLSFVFATVIVAAEAQMPLNTASITSPAHPDLRNIPTTGRGNALADK